MGRFILSVVATFLATSLASAHPSYSKDIRPFFVKYCLECHNAKTMKGALSLETYKAMLDGSDGGAVIVPGKPNDSRLVLLIEHKDKPTMPPPKAKFQPSKDEIKLVRAWIADGAKDDGATVKIELPVIKAKAEVLAPVTALTYSEAGKYLYVARDGRYFVAFFEKSPPEISESSIGDIQRFTFAVMPAGSITGYAAFPKFKYFGVTAISKPGEYGVFMDYGAMYAKIRPEKHKDGITDLILDPNGSWIASASYDTQILLYEWNGKKSHILKEHSDAVYGLAFSPDGKLLASVSADRAMKVFDVEKGKLLYTLGHATDWLYCVAWSPDGKYLVSGGVDKSIRVYDGTRPLTGLGSPTLLQSVFAHEGPVLKVVFSSDSKTLYSVGQDRIVKAWDIEKMVERKVYDQQPETVLCLALREDAGQIIVGRYDGIVQLIDMKTGKVAHEFGRPRKQGPKKKAKKAKSRKLASCLGRRAEGALAKIVDRQIVAHQIRALPRRPEHEDRGHGRPKPFAGTLDRAGAVHFFRFDAKKGQPLGVRLTAEGKAKFDPVLILTDMAGRILAESYDGHLGYTFAEAGSYAIGVRDRDYRGGADFKYRLEVGEIPVVTAVFPLGLQRGTKGDIRLDGVFLPKKMIAFAAPADAKPGQMMPLPIGDGVLGKAQIVVGEFFEVLDGKIPVPGTANGRIQKDNQKDLWSFHAKKGERLIVEVNARRLGSRLDSIIEILDKGQPVPRAVLRSQAKTHVTFRDHDSAQGNIRIETWSELATNDLLYVGNELMKIKELPTHPDADCNFFAADGKRLTYLDTTPTHHANNTPMYKVSVHSPGTTFPPNGYPVFTLYYKNDDGGPGYARDSRIFFEPPADGEYKVRIADARGMGGVNFGYRLTVRRPRPSFNIRFNPTAPVLSLDDGVPLTVSVDRIDGYDGPIAVYFENLGPGMNAPDTTIEAGTYTTAVALHCTPAAPYKQLPLKVVGTAVIDGKKIVQEAVGAIPNVIKPGDLRTWTDESPVTIEPGGQTKLLVHIERAKGFIGRVPLEVRGLPHGVRVLDIGLNGILVNENETKRTVVLYAEPWVQPMERPFVVLAKREGKGTEHAAKAVMLKVK